MDIVKMERNCLGDTRTATHMPTREEFREANWSHKDDVLNLAVAFATELRSRVGNHDWTKVQAPYDEMFYELMKSTIEDGADFMDGEWARLHFDVLERHHLSRHCPSDVTLFDVLEMLFDCVSAGMTRSGSVYPIEISNEILQKAVSNTVDYLVKHIEVADRKTENCSEFPNNSKEGEPMKIIDEIMPKIKAEARLDKDNQTLWIKADTLDGYDRIIIEDGSNWHRIFYEDCGECAHNKAEQDEPTISKMEQVDKDINVRSKTEPQTCSVNGRPYDCGKCEYHKCTADEPQMERPCDNCQEFDCYGCEYKQTERSE